jgi:hypothetical protein
MEDIDNFDMDSHKSKFSPTLDFISGMEYTFSKRIEYRESYASSEGYSFRKKTFITHTVIRNNALGLETIKRVIVCGQCNKLDGRYRGHHKEDCSCFQDFDKNPYPVYDCESDY